ncbi:hypothetical protein BB561_004443, partial [Smittium simulii]
MSRAKETKLKSESASDHIIVKLTVLTYYKNIISKDETISPPIAAISALIEMVKSLKATTISEFVLSVHEAINILITESGDSISIRAGCAVFIQILTKLAQADIMNLDELRRLLIESGDGMIEKANQCKETISTLSSSFIRDNMVILLHSYSRVVMGCLKCAAKQNKRFSVYVTESRPDGSGLKTEKELKELGIPCRIILDASIGYYIAKVDLILLGAEGVVENGGLVNKIGTYQLAVLAKSAGKPLYALAESYKFVRIFPLDQYDLFPKSNKYTDIDSRSSSQDLAEYLN